MPGQGRTQIRSRVTIRENHIPDSELPKVELRTGKCHGIWITKREVIKYGITPRCAGCIAQNGGRTGVAHHARCRERMEKLMQEHEPEKYDKAVTRMLKSSIEEEPEAEKMEVDKAPAQEAIPTEPAEERESKRRKLLEQEVLMDEEKWESCIQCQKCGKNNSALF